MIRHCVMFRWKAGVDEAHIAAVSDGLDALAGLDVVRAYTHGPDQGLREGNFDYGVVADFDTPDDWRTYRDDEGHQALIADLLTPFVEDRAGLQFEIPG